MEGLSNIVYYTLLHYRNYRLFRHFNKYLCGLWIHAHVSWIVTVNSKIEAIFQPCPIAIFAASCLIHFVKFQYELRSVHARGFDILSGIVCDMFQLIGDGVRYATQYEFVKKVCIISIGRRPIENVPFSGFRYHFCWRMMILHTTYIFRSKVTQGSKVIRGQIITKMYF